MKAFQVYHLNLAFSSIATQARGEVIDRCYTPLLDLVEQAGLPIGIELTGWTLQQILELRPAWVERFRALLDRGVCELIGSGWSQLIGPLVPASVNRWNQQLGLQAYEQRLGIRPRLVLVNEMAFSSSMVDLYAEVGYEGIIMDRDNVRLALDLDHHPEVALPTHACGLRLADGLPVLWSDSVLFQRFQRVVHGDIPISEYLQSLRLRMQRERMPVMPLYCNDAEIFDYRPGRFTTESRLHPDGEWNRIARVLEQAQQALGLQWVSPSQALAEVLKTPRRSGRLSSAAHPIPVKKQAKYNINRWAVSGRDNLWLNSRCHQWHRLLQNEPRATASQWRELCEFWASDLRTHITAERWQEACDGLQQRLPEPPAPSLAPEAPTASADPRFSISRDEEDILWTFETSELKLVLNARRGLTLRSLAFAKHQFEPLVGTLAQGHFDSIELAADYYSGGVLIEIPGERVRLTDLEWLQPQWRVIGDELWIEGELPLAHGSLRKAIVIDLQGQSLRLHYGFRGWQRPVGLVRVGILTLLPQSCAVPLELTTHLGGDEAESFVVEQRFNHTASSSFFVSSSSALGATKGELSIVEAAGRGLRLQWDPSACAAMPMFKHLPTPSSHLSRLSFSLCELDDTSKSGGRMLDFAVTVTPL